MKQKLEMDNFKRKFKSFLIEKSKNENEIKWRKENKILQKMLDDIVKSSETDFVDSYNILTSEAFINSLVFISQPKLFSSLQIYFFENTNERMKNSYGGYEPEFDEFYFNLFKFKQIGLRNPTSFNDGKEMLKHLFRHPLFGSVLHHEIAHFRFAQQFQTLDNYKNFRKNDHMDNRDVSEEEFNSLISEIYHLWKVMPFLNELFKTEEGINNFIDQDNDPEDYIRNLKKRLQLFNRDKVVKRLIKFNESLDENSVPKNLETMDKFWRVFNSRNWIPFSITDDDIKSMADSLGIELNSETFKDI